MKYGELKEILKKYLKEDELKLVDKAYEYALNYHAGQKRLTGEQYISHPVSVASILANINADAATICAALLHDVLEDTICTKEEMKEHFGEEITHLVEGVTKINNLSFKDGSNESEIANQRKIIVGLTEDVRVIIIKLADRLDNMRSLWVHPEDKQKRKARETLDLLIPIAHRLGMNKIKSELEELCLRYLKPDVYFDVVEKLNQSKKERDDLVLEMQKSVSDVLNEHGIKHEIKGRAKSIYSIYKKLDTGRRWSDIYDLLALRVFVDTEADCYQALGIIHSKFKPLPKRFKDYIAMPKTNMYQSLHTTVIGVEGHLFEIQIRTYEMDEVAEHGIASHWSYKEHKSMTSSSMQNEMEQKLQFFRSIIDLRNEESDDADFVNSVKEEVFKNTIYVFTPKGDVIELPAGSTPIDFAYRVHSGVGEKMVGAVVNNQIVPLDYELKDNDIIKINTNKNSLGPNREWINMAKTASAKNKIKAFFNRIDKDEYSKKGEDLLLKELRKKKLTINEFLSDQNINKLLDDFKLGDLNELYINIGNGKIQPISLINCITNTNDTKEDIILRKTQNKEIVLPNSKNDIIVQGIDEVKVNIASCCKPIPGDRIIGYITKGYGITVHRMMCPNVAELEERFIDVAWNEEIEKKYPTTILIHTMDTKDILLDIISKTSGNSISVESIKTMTSSDKNIYDLTVLVKDKEHLFKFIHDIENIKEVTEVERAVK